MLAIVHACAIVGLDGCIVDVQVDFNPRAGLPSFTIVGLPSTAVKESRERVRSAIRNSNRYSKVRNLRQTPSRMNELESMPQDQKRHRKDQHEFGLQFPNKAYVVNLSPADLPKHSTAYDLAIAVGVLAATDQVPLPAVQDAVFIGELSLDGSVRHVKGVMPMTLTAKEAGFSTVYVAAEDAAEAALVPGMRVIPLQSLGEMVEHLYDLDAIAPFVLPPEAMDGSLDLPDDLVDFADVKGQEHVKRGLEIAAAGNHNIILTGSPGVGKSLLARAVPGILPRLTLEEALEVTRIYSVADMLNGSSPLARSRPFRAPHHTISQAGLVGGGTIPRPGEISLAHRGILFLDEIVEHSTKTLEVLRQPIEDKIVTISRAQGTVTFPANFLLIAARNPCPCGYYGDNTRACTCSPTLIQRYQAKLSGPLLDRIDIHVDVPRVDYDKLMSDRRGEPSKSVRERVERARTHQNRRFKEHPGLFANADMSAGEVQQFCAISAEARQLLELSVRRMQLSARSYHRMLKLSRTIADLGDSRQIEVNHVAESIQYRPKN